MPENSERLGMFCAILSAVFFGTMPLFTRTAYLYGSNAWSAAFARYVFGGAIMLLFFTFSPGHAPRITPQQGRRLLLLSFFQAATPVLLYLSYNTIDSGLATTLHFTYPVMVILLMTLLRHVPLTRQKLLCAALCVAGVLCFYTPGGRAELRGMALAVLSALTFALYILILGNSGLNSLPVLTATFWISVFAAAEIGAVAFLLGELNLDVGWQAWAAWGCLGLFATVFAIALFQKGVFLCGEVNASLLSNFEPLTGVTLGVLVFGEALTWRIAAGVVCILAAAALTTRIKR